MANASNKFNDLFNRLMSPATGQNYNQQPINIRHPQTANRANIARGASNVNRSKISSQVTADLAAARMKIISGGGSWGGSNREPASFGVPGFLSPPKPEDDFRSPEQVTEDQVRTGNGRSRLAANNLLLGSEGDEGESGGGLLDKGLGFLGRVGDVVSRPIYATAGAGQHVMEGVLEGQDWDELGDEVWTGLGRGLTGKEKFTPGDLVQTTSDAYRDNTTKDFGFMDTLLFGLGGAVPTLGGNIGGAVAGQLDEVFDDDNGNWLTNNLRRGGGLYGELFADPVNLAGGAVIGVPADVARFAKKGSSTLDSVRSGQNVETLIRKHVPESVADAKTTINAAGSGALINVPMSTKIAQRVVAAAQKSIGNAVNEGGTQAGKWWAVHDPVQYASEIAVVKLGVRETLMAPLVKKIPKVRNGTLKPGTAAWDKAKDSDEWFAKFADEYEPLEAQLAADFRGVSTEAIDPVADALDLATRGIDDIANEAAESFGKDYMAQFYNTAGVRVGPMRGPNVKVRIPVASRYIGRGWQKAATSGVGKATKGSIGKTMSLSKALPGQTGRSLSHVRRSGVKEYDELYQKTRELLASNRKVFNKANRERIQHALDDGTNFADEPILQQGLDFLRDEYRALHASEVSAGVRTSTNALADNYSYLQVRTLRKDPKTQWLKDRRAAIQDQSHIPREYTIRGGMDKGLRIERDPFRNLMFRKMKSNRDISRSGYMQEIFNTYGTVSNMSPSVAKRMGFTNISDQSTYKINEFLAKIPNKGEKLFIPDDVAKVYETFDSLSKLNFHADMGAFTRLYDKAMNLFKTQATLPHPGFHVKNMAGDIFFSFLDGVRADDWTRYAKHRAAAKLQGGENHVVRLADNVNMTWDELEGSYTTYAASGGFTGAELPPASGFGIAQRSSGTLKKFSEAREDMGRMVHYYHALRQEAKNVGRIKGRVKRAEAMDAAQRRAASRVDYYKFDYGAVTKFEKTVMRRIMPFYTFNRKALPVLLEGLFTNPALYGKVHRMYEGDPDLALGVKDWVSEYGFASWGGEDGPSWVMPNNFFPNNALNEFIPKDPKNIQDWVSQGFEGTVGSNPLASFFRETSTGTDSFTGAPTGGGNKAFNTLKNLLGMETEGRTKDLGNPELIANLITQLNPALGTVESLMPESLTGHPQTYENMNEVLLGSRAGLGTGAQQLDDDEINRQLDSRVHDLYERMGDVNDKINPQGLHMFLSNRDKQGSSVRIKDRTTSDVVFNGTLPQAMSWLKQQGLA